MYKVRIAASQSAILPRSTIGRTEIPLSLNINIPRAINWSDVFNFAILDTGTLTFIPAKYSLKPETAIQPKEHPFFIPDFSKEIDYEIELIIKILLKVLMFAI